MQASQQGLVALIFSSFLSSGCAAVQHAVRDSIEYQRSLKVVYTLAIPGEGTYDVFVDTRTNTCNVGFVPDSYFDSFSSDPFYRSDPLYLRHPNLFYEQELMDKYCPKQESTPSPSVSSVPSPQSL